MDDQFTRVEFIIGKEKLEKLHKKRVAIFGIGGVGSFVAEGLVRSGVGRFDLIDKDEIDVTNINRQIHATHRTIGQEKVEVMAARMKEINSDAEIIVHKTFFLPDTSDKFDFSQYDYVVDAVDTVTAKIEIITKAVEAGVPVISSMGAGNKMDPTRFQVADIYKTSVDPLAKVMRRELKKRGIKKLKVVFSTEEPQVPEFLHVPDKTGGERTKLPPASLAFVPSVVGFIIASQIFREFTEE